MCKNIYNDGMKSDNIYAINLTATNGNIQNLTVSTLTAGNIDLSDVVRSGINFNENYINCGEGNGLKVKETKLKAINTQVEGFPLSSYVSGGNFGDLTHFNNLFCIKAYIRKDGTLEAQSGGIINVIYNTVGEYRIEFDNTSGFNPWVYGMAFSESGRAFSVQVLKLNPTDITINTYNITNQSFEDCNFFIYISSVLL